MAHSLQVQGAHAAGTSRERAGRVQQVGLWGPRRRRAQTPPECYSSSTSGGTVCHGVSCRPRMGAARTHPPPARSAHLFMDMAGRSTKPSTWATRAAPSITASCASRTTSGTPGSSCVANLVLKFAATATKASARRQAWALGDKGLAVNFAGTTEGPCTLCRDHRRRGRR